MKAFSIFALVMLFVYLFMGAFGVYKIYGLYYGKGTELVPRKVADGIMFPYAALTGFLIIIILYAYNKFKKQNYNASVTASAIAIVVGALFFAYA